MELTDKNIKSGKILRNTTFICMIIGCYFLSYNFSYCIFSYSGDFTLLLRYTMQELSIIVISGILLLIGVFIRNKSAKSKYHHIQFYILLGFLMIFNAAYKNRQTLDLFTLNETMKFILVAISVNILFFFKKNNISINYKFMDDSIIKYFIKVLIIVIICYVSIASSNFIVQLVNGKGQFFLKDTKFLKYYYKLCIVDGSVLIIPYVILSIIEKIKYIYNNSKIDLLVIGILFGMSVLSLIGVRNIQNNSYGYISYDGMSSVYTYDSILLISIILFITNLVYIKEYFKNYKFVLKSINITILITLVLFYLEFVLLSSIDIAYILFRKELIPVIKDMSMADIFNSYSYIVSALIRTVPLIKYIIFGLVIISMIIQSKFSKIILIPFILLVIGYSYIFIEVIMKYSQNIYIEI